jgi:hypothetical protein
MEVKVETIRESHQLTLFLNQYIATEREASEGRLVRWTSRRILARGTERTVGQLL